MFISAEDAATIPASQVPTPILAQMTALVVNEGKRYAIAALKLFQTGSFSQNRLREPISRFRKPFITK